MNDNKIEPKESAEHQLLRMEYTNITISLDNEFIFTKLHSNLTHETKWEVYEVTEV